MPMTVHHLPADRRELRRRIERLDGLPLRPASARLVLSDLSPDGEGTSSDLPAPARPADLPRRPALIDLDPGWVIERLRLDTPPDPLTLVEARAWWPADSRQTADALTHFWRHSVALCLAARRLAREANDPDPERLGRVALLSGLGQWAAAAVSPDWLPHWLSIVGAESRRAFECATLGEDASSLGRDLAERWGCDPLLAEAAWLVGDGALGVRPSPRLELIQKAHAWAEQTPWAVGASDTDIPHVDHHDPRLKVLTAEVQSRCAGAFRDPDATTHEERVSRDSARLRRRVAELESQAASNGRFLQAFAASTPGDSPETWAERAGLAWCAEPGVASARVDWVAGGAPDDALTAPSVELPLKHGRQTLAVVRLRAEGDGFDAGRPPLDAWRAWARAVHDRASLHERLSSVTEALRVRSALEESRLRLGKLSALAEFAAGAGHEMNNPLAVIVGRAQLLLAKEDDPQAARSLRAIITQARRAHKILRDLMFVAKPPEPRPRSCVPDEIWKAALRDTRTEADERQVRLVADGLEHGRRVWADPDSLRHLADVLLRNALEATPAGGAVRVTTTPEDGAFRWTVRDDGKGITPAEAEHLFDPFFCGRQAGRGLGMGLPRAAKVVERLGGEIRWHAHSGQGAAFSVRIPHTEPPKPPTAEIVRGA